MRLWAGRCLCVSVIIGSVLTISARAAIKQTRDQSSSRLLSYIPRDRWVNGQQAARSEQQQRRKNREPAKGQEGRIQKVLAHRSFLCCSVSLGSAKPTGNRKLLRDPINSRSCVRTLETCCGSQDNFHKDKPQLYRIRKDGESQTRPKNSCEPNY